MGKLAAFIGGAVTGAAALTAAAFLADRLSDNRADKIALNTDEEGDEAGIDNASLNQEESGYQPG